MSHAKAGCPKRTSQPAPSSSRAAENGKTISQAYQLEYGEAVVELHDDALHKGQKVLLVDDLLATGGTAEAGIKLIERLGAEVVACAFIIDLKDLGGRKLLEGLGHRVEALCAYEGA